MNRRLITDLVLYTLARIALVAVLAATIMGVAYGFGVEVPLLVALVFAVLVAFPLSFILFRGLQRKLAEDIAEVSERRQAIKADLRARLRGDQSS